MKMQVEPAGRGTTIDETKFKLVSTFFEVIWRLIISILILYSAGTILTMDSIIKTDSTIHTIAPWIGLFILLWAVIEPFWSEFKRWGYVNN